MVCIVKRMSDRPKSRPYRKTLRARQEAETRERITLAAVELHESVGPAHTRMTDVAELAGVSRATVYNHFGSEEDLFVACSSHWARANPFPDPAVWSAVDDVERRLATALRDLYGWYSLKRGMLGMVFRDVAVVPALAHVMEQVWEPFLDAVVDVLEDDWSVEGDPSGELRALLRWVVDFPTWRSLSTSGLQDEAAAELLSRAVTRALPPD